jgi:hypothetical protein
VGKWLDCIWGDPESHLFKCSLYARKHVKSKLKRVADVVDFAYHPTWAYGYFAGGGRRLSVAKDRRM